MESLIFNIDNLVEGNELMGFLRNITLAFIGLLIYSIFEARKHLRNFDIKIFFAHNKPFWIWATMLQVLFAALIAISPSSAQAISDMTTIDFNKPHAFTISGMLLSHAANITTKKK